MTQPSPTTTPEMADALRQSVSDPGPRRPQDPDPVQGPGFLETERPSGRSGSGGAALPRLGSASKTWYTRHGHRALDIAILLVALPPAFVLGSCIALLNAVVFADPRQVFFLQERVGRDGKVFRLVKFRTMREASGDAYSSWSGGEDRLRVTRFGRFLRNSHLDELPQLLNVLVGQMSIIGPRPEMLEIESWAESEIPGFGRRLAIRPGITGYAQITQGYTGRDVKAYREKLEKSEWYRARMSLRLDLEILLRTAVWMVRGRGWDWKAGVTPEAAFADVVTPEASTPATSVSAAATNEAA